MSLTTIIIKPLMKKLVCPQCRIAAMFVKNDLNERRLVYVNEKKEIVPKNPEESLDGFDLSVVYCLGCSWSGLPSKMIKY